MDALVEMRARLKARIALINKPSPRSHDDVMPYQTDDDVFFHYKLGEIWAHKIFAVNPTDRKSREILLPKDMMSMQDSFMCQIRRDLFQFSWLDLADPTKIYKIEGLSSGTQSCTELATLDRFVGSFSLSFDLRRYIYISGGKSDRVTE